MKHLQPLVFTSALLSPLIAGCNVHYQSGYHFNYSGETSKYQEEGEIQAHVKSVVIDHRFGDVHISPIAQGESPGWRWNLTTWADDHETAKFFMDQVVLETLTEEGSMSWRLLLPESPGSDLNGVKSILWLSLAEGVEVKLGNAHGDAILQGLDGAIETDLSHGDADYSDLTGKLRLRHAHGSVDLSNVQSGRLKLSHGDLRANGIHDSFQLKLEHSELEASQIAKGLQLDMSHSEADLKDLAGAFRFDGSHSDLMLSGDPASLVLDGSHTDLEVWCEGDALNFVEAGFEHGDFDLFLPAGSNVDGKYHTNHGSASETLSADPARKLVRVEVNSSHGDFRLRAAD